MWLAGARRVVAYPVLETDDDEPPDDDTVTVVEITDELDLHHFRPSDLKELIPDYLDEAVTRGFTTVRIIHGKGTGALRNVVREYLAGHPAVAKAQLAPPNEGGDGATVATLRET